jgi:hypothetical protein
MDKDRFGKSGASYSMPAIPARRKSRLFRLNKHARQEVSCVAYALQCAYNLHSEDPDCRKMSREVVCQL